MAWTQSDLKSIENSFNNHKKYNSVGKMTNDRQNDQQSYNQDRYQVHQDPLKLKQRSLGNFHI